jgi:hypothetical protein
MANHDQLTAQYTHSVHIPDRDLLHNGFDRAVIELDQARKPMLTTPFYTAIGESVFDAGYQALQHFVEYYTPFSAADRWRSSERVHVVSAPAGSGKTSFSTAFVAALVRYHEQHPSAPYGALLVCQQIDRADDIYRDLNALLPGKVAVWSSEHDLTCPASKREKVPHPAAQFARDQLQDYPVAIVTHKFFGGPNSHKARLALHNGNLQPRAFTVVDERIDDVTVLDIQLSDAEKVRELAWDDPEHARTIGPPMNALVEFMREHGDKGPNLERPTAEWATVTDQLAFFTSEAAADYARCHPGTPAIETVFSFARALARGYAFITRPTAGQHTAHFIGYANNLTIEPGTIQLDATADIDGALPLCPWRILQPVLHPARYDNLHVVSVPSLLARNQRIHNYLKFPKNRRAYTDWMADIIRTHMEPGQRGLVVCKLALIEQEALPAPEWELGGRKLAVTHWGKGIGSNAWQEAEVVFLFDEFFIPKGVSIATAQGLLGANAMRGPLQTMRHLNSPHTAVDSLWEGHLLRQLKQMALRGHGRQFDGQGICGVQKLVTSADRTRLLSNWDQLFPGAQRTLIDPPTAGAHERTHAQALLSYLSQAGRPNIVTTKDISKQLGKPWREIVQHLKGDVKRAIEGLGYRYVPVKGRPPKGQRGSRFERMMTKAPRGESRAEGSAFSSALRPSATDSGPLALLDF